MFFESYNIQCVCFFAQWYFILKQSQRLVRFQQTWERPWHCIWNITKNENTEKKTVKTLHSTWISIEVFFNDILGIE